MAEKTTKKATATKAVATKKVAAEEAAPKAPAKKAACKKAPAKKVAAPVAVNAENVGFKAGDVYQTLAKAEKALTVAEIAKQAKISNEEVLLGLGWLLKEGKVKGENELISLA